MNFKVWAKLISALLLSQFLHLVCSQIVTENTNLRQRGEEAGDVKITSDVTTAFDDEFDADDDNDADLKNLEDVMQLTDHTLHQDPGFESMTTMPHNHTGKEDATPEVTTPRVAKKPRVPPRYAIMTFEEAGRYIKFRDKIGLTVIIISLVIGLPGGLLNILVWSQKEMRVGSTSVYLLALSLADFLYMLTACINELKSTELTKYDWFRSFHHKINIPVAYIYFASSYLSIFVTVAMTIERYIVTALPLKAAQLCTRRRATITCIVLAIAVFGYNIAVLFMFRSRIFYDVFKERLNLVYTLTPLALNNRSFNTGYKYINLLVKLIIPFVMLAVFNTLIIIALRRSRIRRATMTTHQRAEYTREEAITKVLIALVVSFLILTLPIIVANILSAILHIQYAFSYNGGILTSISETIFMMNPMINFFIFGALNSKFRQGLKRLVKRKKGSLNRKGSQPSSTKKSDLSRNDTPVPEHGTPAVIQIPKESEIQPPAV